MGLVAQANKNYGESVARMKVRIACGMVVEMVESLGYCLSLSSLHTHTHTHEHSLLHFNRKHWNYYKMPRGKEKVTLNHMYVWCVWWSECAVCIVRNTSVL